MLRRQPTPDLRPFVSQLWASEPPRNMVEALASERVLPTGSMHLVFRSSSRTLRICDDPQGDATNLSTGAVVGGARDRSYLRQFVPDGNSVGAELRAGASTALFGVPANELAARHTRLDDLWVPDAMFACEYIFATTDPTRQLAAFEMVLRQHLSRTHGLHPAVATALAGFRGSASVHAVVAASGYSHRHFIALFEREIGLAPKRYCRVQRFRNLLARAATQPATPWTELALDGGYSDQAHFNREFRALAGLTPGDYRRARPRFPHHVSIATPQR